MRVLKPAGKRNSNHLTKRRPGLRLEPLEDRCLLSIDFRTIDGSNNNLSNPTWGKVGTNFVRLSPTDYTDGSSFPAGADRPSAREISNVVGAQGTQDTPNDRRLSAYISVFGQFLAHDLSLITPATYINGQPCCPYHIAVPKGDPYFDPEHTGTKKISFFRSKWDPYTGYSENNPREQFDEITSWIDGSMIYGSDATRAAALRTFEGGRLKVSDGDMLIYNTLGLPNQNQGPFSDESMFLSGDIRANENIQLTALHTLFHREHNWWADQIASTHPLFSDEQIYQAARRIIGAELQVIAYNEFIPALLGPNALPAYTGYKTNVNGTISNEFSTAGFRFGHTTINSVVPRINNEGKVISSGNLTLKDTFFNPTLLDPNLPNGEGDIDPLLKGAATQRAQEIDSLFIDDIRNFLFGPPGAGGFDLAALNTQRGRDHGLTDYNTMRESYGLPRVTSFAQITSNVAIQQGLEMLYGTVDNIDAYIGGLAEDHVAGGSVGPLFKAIMIEQFTRLRDGDRFWYQRTFTGTQLYYVQQTSLAKIIKRNTDLTNVQANVFFVRRGPSGGNPIPPPSTRSAIIGLVGSDIPTSRPSVVTMQLPASSETADQTTEARGDKVMAAASRVRQVKKLEVSNVLPTVGLPDVI